MKNIVLLLMVVLLVGCSTYEYEGKSLGAYLENPGDILKDPHFAAYKEKRDVLESQYLREEIPYAVYVTKRQELDDQYNKEVLERENKVNAFGG